VGKGKQKLIAFSFFYPILKNNFLYAVIKGIGVCKKKLN